jgi:anti-anti-sigma factor
MIDIKTNVLPGSVIRVSVVGEVDMATAQQLDAALTAAVERDGAAAVEVDFAGVTFCDSIGVAGLDRAYAAAAQFSRPFRLINVQPGVGRVLAIVGLLDALTEDRQL